MNRKIIATRIFLMLLATIISLIAAVPYIAVTYVDFRQPLKITRIDPKDHDSGVDIHYVNGNLIEIFDAHLADNYQEFDVPQKARLNFLSILAIVAALTTVGMLVMFVTDETGDVYFFPAIGSFMLLVVFLGFAIGSASWQSFFDLKAEFLKVTGGDKKLVEDAIRIIHIGLFMNAFFSFIFMIVLGFICYVIAAYTYDSSHWMKGKIISAVQQMASDKEHIIIDHNNTVALGKCVSRFQFAPFPHIRFDFKREHEHSLDFLYHLMMRPSKRQAFDDLRGLLAINSARDTLSLGAESVALYAQKLSDGAQEVLAELSFEMAIDDVRQNAQDTMQKVVDDNLQRFKGDLGSSVSEIVQNCLDSTASEINKAYRSLVVGLIGKGNAIDKPYPDGLKYNLCLDTHGLFIFQAPPQVRSLLFDERFLDQTRSNEMNKTGQRDVPVQLALPYTIFVVQLSGSGFASLHVFFSNEPLRNFDQQICLPCLPNVYSSGVVCLGNQNANGETPVEQARSIVDNFWQSTFNTDLMKQCLVPSLRRDNCVSSLVDWHKRTIADASFATTVDWLPAPEKSLAVIVNDFVTKHAPQLGGKLLMQTEKQLEGLRDQIVAKVEAYVNGLEMERQYPSLAQNNLEQQLQALTGALCKHIRAAVESNCVPLGEKELERVIQTCVSNQLEQPFNELADRVQMKRLVGYPELTAGISL